jgi:hypothetical protein
MNRRMTMTLLLLAAPLALGGCAAIFESIDDDDCRPSRPEDPTTPSEWVCDEMSPSERIEQRHRMQRDG